MGDKELNLLNKKDVNVFFAPVSSGGLFLNFEKSVMNGISLSFFDSKYHRYFNKSDKIVRLWGIRDAKKAAYDRTKVGNYVFFYKEGFIIGYSKIYSLFIDEELSNKIWGIFENKQRGEVYSWSNIIVFEDFNNCNIPFSKFNELANYSDNYSVRGYLEYRDFAVEKIINEFGGIEQFVKSFK